MYKLTWKEYEQMYLCQKGCCALCQAPVGLTKINVDHNHQTGKVRGLLCSGCNTFIAFIENRGHLLNKIKQYLNNTYV
ncbi:MAG: hypothetical protein GTO44_06970 [Hydrotalea flava]|nr:hypothetical protein [Hydrotalea flava]NIN14838.1 hypothetical protein [Hydrotalea flava]